MILHKTPYSFSDFSSEFQYLLNKINAPADTPKLDLCLSLLKYLQAIKLEKEFTALCKIDLSLIDNDRAEQLTQVDVDIYSDSPFYGWLVKDDRTIYLKNKGEYKVSNHCANFQELS